MPRLFLNRRIRGGDKDLDPYFTVRRDKLVNADGDYVGFDALINEPLKKTMAIVSEGYCLELHKEASEVVHTFLADAGMEHETMSLSTANNGAQYYEVVQFPAYRFGILPKGKDTSLDNGRASIDEYIPTITIRSSYNKLSPTEFDFGAYRLLCTNGLSIGNTINKFSVRHSQKLVVDKIRQQFKMDLERSISNLQIRLPELNQQSAIPYVKSILFDKTVPARFKKDLLELASSAIICNFDVEEALTGKKKKVIESVETSLTAYAFLNVMTQVITHNMKNAARRQAMLQRVSREFQI